MLLLVTVDEVAVARLLLLELRVGVVVVVTVPFTKCDGPSCSPFVMVASVLEVAMIVMLLLLFFQRVIWNDKCLALGQFHNRFNLHDNAMATAIKNGFAAIISRRLNETRPLYNRDSYRTITHPAQSR